MSVPGARERRLAVGPGARRAVGRRHGDRRPRVGRDPHEHRHPGHRIRGARPAAAVQLHGLRRRQHVDRHGDGGARAAAREAPAAGRARRRRQRASRRHRHRAGARQRLPSRCRGAARAARPARASTISRASRSSTATPCATRRPTQPGVYTAVYTIGDDYEQTARATLHFTVVAKDAGENRPPLPTPLTSRTFAGSAVTIDVPLDGLDPDGDSVVLTGITQPPRRSVASWSARARSFTYEAFAGVGGHRHVHVRGARHLRRDGDRHDPHRGHPAAGRAAAAEGGRRRDRDEARAARPRSRCCSTTPTRAATRSRVAELARGRRGHRCRDPQDRRRVVVKAPDQEGALHDPIRDLERPRRRRHRVPAGGGDRRRRDRAADGARTRSSSPRRSSTARRRPCDRSTTRPIPAASSTTSS